VSPPSSSSLAEEKRLPSLPWPPSGQGSTYTTTVTRHGRVDLRISAVLPDGATVTSATLDGSPVEPKLVQTDPWVGCCDLGTARAAYGDSGNQHCQLIFGACCSRIARFKSACSSSLAEKGAPPLTPPYHAPGARLPTLTAWSGDYSTAQDHVAWGAQHGEVDTRISIEDHQIGWHPFAEPGRVAEPRARAPGTGPQRIFRRAELP
jgi:hypothetical protein